MVEMSKIMVEMLNMRQEHYCCQFYTKDFVDVD